MHGIPRPEFPAPLARDREPLPRPLRTTPAQVQINMAAGRARPPTAADSSRDAEYAAAQARLLEASELADRAKARAEADQVHPDERAIKEAAHATQSAPAPGSQQPAAARGPQPEPTVHHVDPDAEAQTKREARDRPSPPQASTPHTGKQTYGEQRRGKRGGASKLGGEPAPAPSGSTAPGDEQSKAEAKVMSLAASICRSYGQVLGFDHASQASDHHKEVLAKAESAGPPRPEFGRAMEDAIKAHTSGYLAKLQDEHHTCAKSYDVTALIRADVELYAAVRRRPRNSTSRRSPRMGSSTSCE
eukprot:SAG22_NODE_276_length_13167_cov_8.415825_18_plen_303_part_00